MVRFSNTDCTEIGKERTVLLHFGWMRISTLSVEVGLARIDQRRSFQQRRMQPLRASNGSCTVRMYGCRP
jgi:hypothetical protein